MSAAPAGETAVSDRPHSLPYNAALDGLRGLAIAGVMGTHFGVPAFAHGGSGVDLFFVLSGFLITRVLLDAVPSQTLAEFYWNRLTRLAPALLLVCAAYAAVGVFVFDTKQMVEDIAATLTDVANWTRAYDVGTPQYLAQAWSLSLEEQFYILYPPLLLILSRRLSRNRLALVLAALSGLVLLHRTVLVASGGSPDRVYNGLDTHSDGLALGGALAAALPALRSSRAAAVIARWDVVALLAMPLLFACVPWPAAPVCTNVAAAWLVLGATCADRSPAGVVLCVPPLVWLGRISYGLYLWHYPVQQVLADIALLPWLETLLIGVPLSIALAGLSYAFLEAPILRWRRTLARPLRRGLGALGAGLTVAAMSAGAGYFLVPLIVQSVASPAFAVAGYAPHESPVGAGFNVQPGGLSVVWVETTAAPPRPLSASWDGRPLALYPQARRIAVFIPRAFTETAGRKTIELSVGGRDIPLDIEINGQK